VSDFATDLPHQTAELVKLAQTPPGRGPKKPLPTTTSQRIQHIDHEVLDH
jgi:hypothetical protein